VTRRDLLGAMTAAALAVACRNPAAGPVEIVFGRDQCAYCRMPIDDPHLAAEFIPNSGPVHKFGEPGCLVNWMRKSRPSEGSAFVTDGAAGGWVPAATAAYVVGRVRTPMSYDVAAYRSPPADAPADQMRTWAALLAEGAAVAPSR
jgi:copper chaperone NosL